MVAAYLVMMVAVTGIVGLWSAAGAAPPPPPHNTEYLLSVTVGLLAVIVVWRRYCFLPSDLAALLEAHGSRVERARWWAGRTVRGRIGDFWLLAMLDGPMRSYWPIRLYRVTPQGLVPVAQSGFGPGYMLRAAKVDLILPGDFTRLPHATISLPAHALASDSARTGDAALDRALRDAARAMRSADAPLTFEITDRRLRLATTGGSWLGAEFGRRIEDLIAAMNILSTALAGRFTATPTASVE